MKKVSNRLYIARKIFDYTVVFLLLGFLFFIWQLYRGPIAVPFLKPYIIAALNHDSETTEVLVDSVNIELVRSIKPIKIIANDVTYKTVDDKVRLNAPKVSVSFSIKALLHGIIAPSSIEVINPSVYVFTSYGVQEQDKAAEITNKKLDYYVTQFENFIEKFNSEDNAYPESYINDIRIKGGEVEFHEVDLGRKWVISDLNYRFERNFTNMQTDINGFVNLQDKMITIGLDAEYRPLNNKLALQLYFSDLVPADLIESYVAEDKKKDFYRINLPISGRVMTMINFEEFSQNRDNLIDAVNTAIEKISFEFEGGNGNIIFADEKSKYDISSFVLEGEISGGLDNVVIKNANFNLGEQKVVLGFDVSGLGKYLLEDDKKDLKLVVTANIKKLKLDDLYVYWPRYIASDAWEWCKDSIFGGDAEDAKFRFEFAYDDKAKSFGFADLSGGAYIRDSNLRYINTMPMVKNLYGEFKVNKNSIEIVLDKATSDGILLDEGMVRIYDLDKYNNYIDIKLVSTSSISDALKLIDHEPLKFASQMGLKPDLMQGEAATELSLHFELRNDLGYNDVKVIVKSILSNVNIANAVADKPITANELALEVDNTGMLISGEAFYEGIPLQIVWSESFTNSKNYRSRYKVLFKANPEVSKKFGIDYSMLQAPYFEGYADVEAIATIAKNDDVDIAIKAALRNAAMNYSFLGFVKSLNENAEFSAKLDFRKKKLAAIPEFSLTKQDFVISGKAETDKNGNLKIIDIGNIKGPKTRASAKIELAESKKYSTKVNVSGNSYDLSEFFERKEKSDNQAAIKDINDDNDSWEDTPNMHINIAVNSLWTNPNVPVTNFAGSAKLVHGIGVNEIHLVGNYDYNRDMNIKLDYIPRPNKEFLLAINSNHAGNTFKVLRIYDNLSGGNLQIEAKRGKDKRFVGHAKIRDFSLHNTPVLARLLTVASFTGMVDLLRGEGMTFSHFDAPFKYKNKLLSVNDAKAYGNVLGMSFKGGYNMASDDVSIEGMLAPAYGLNTMIGKIPLVGNLLAGKDGTVFAANYSISGKASNPEVSFNPLSALSPNSLKEAVASVFGREENDY